MKPWYSSLGKGLKEVEEEMNIVKLVYDCLGTTPVALNPLDKFKQLCAAYPARMLSKFSLPK